MRSGWTATVDRCSVLAGVGGRRLWTGVLSWPARWLECVALEVPHGACGGRGVFSVQPWAPLARGAASISG